MNQRNFPAHILLAASMAASIACVDSAGSITILRNQEPGVDCTVNNGDNFLSRGQIDTNAEFGYIFTPLVQNNAEQIDSADRRFFASGANVDLKFEDDFFSGAELDALSESGHIRFRQDFSGSIASGQDAAFTFEVIPQPTLEEIGNKLADQESTQVTVEVEVVGELNGSSISSNVFKYPVTVCKGCLIQDLGECASLPNVQIQNGGDCQPLQDGVLSCCNGPGGELVCPAQNSDTE